MRRKATALFIAILTALAALTGCATYRPDTITLYDLEALRIDRTGAETRIYDRVGNGEYTLTRRTVRERKPQTDADRQERDQAKTIIDKPTIKIETVHGLLIVTVRSTGDVYYIE